MELKEIQEKFLMKRKNCNNAEQSFEKLPPPPDFSSPPDQDNNSVFVLRRKYEYQGKDIIEERFEQRFVDIEETISKIALWLHKETELRDGAENKALSLQGKNKKIRDENSIFKLGIRELKEKIKKGSENLAEKLFQKLVYILKINKKKKNFLEKDIQTKTHGTVHMPILQLHTTLGSSQQTKDNPESLNRVQFNQISSINQKPLNRVFDSGQHPFNNPQKERKQQSAYFATQ